MGGIDQKTFELNDIVPIIIRNPVNSASYEVKINCDVNGFTW